MNYPQAYIDYLIYFHAERDFFECHEVLEEYWKSKEGAKQKHWVGLIQIAVALYHYRRGNDKGAMKMLKGASKIIENHQKEITHLGMNVEQLLITISELTHAVLQQKAYADIDLPLNDYKLLETCKTLCDEKGMKWGSKSDFSNSHLIHKHTLRNREDVILEREKQKAIKEQNR